MDFQGLSDRMALEAGGSIRVGTRIDHGSGNEMTWHQHRVGERATHHYRTILPHESVFDLGDRGDDGGGWALTVRETHALWLALNRMVIPFWGALSGGGGTHTHVFGPRGCDPDSRNAWTGDILDVATTLLGHELEADPRLLAPAAETRQCREFGRRKFLGAPTRKMLWTERTVFLPLPPTREQAYAIAEARGLVYPSAIPHSVRLASLDRSWQRDILEDAVCPRSPCCLPHLNTNDDWFGRCAECPFLEEY